MPFDGMASTHILSRAHEQSLDAVLAATGVVPVPQAILHAHKAHEIAKHPPSFFYERRRLLNICGFGSLISSMFVPSVTIPLTLHAPLAVKLAVLVYTVLSFAVLVKLTLFTGIREPARWEEYRLRNGEAPSQTTIPLPIRQLAVQVQNTDPSVRFIVGTLFQETIMLDPYLCVEKIDHATGRRETACLGVWDGDNIIHLAEPRID